MGTKRAASKIVREEATKAGMPYVSHRWLGGMLTNFRTVRSRLQRLEQLEAMAEDGSLESESKKQASRLKREMRKIKANLQGVRNMSRLPGAVVVIDAKKEYLALCEAKKLGIVTVGILDTDSDPDTVDVAIPANDDSIRALDLLLNELADAVAIGKTMVAARQESAPRPRRIRSKRTVLASASRKKQETAAVDEQSPMQTSDSVSQNQPAEQQEP